MGIVAADERDGLRVYDFHENRRVSSWSNSHHPSSQSLLSSHSLLSSTAASPLSTSRVCSLSLINPTTASPHLLVGSDDGVVRLWRNWNSGQPELITAWRALTDMLAVPKSRGSGLLVDWRQHDGILAATGDSRIIRLWDSEKSLSIQDVPTQSDFCVTSLSFDRNGGNTFVAGYADGSVRFFDLRSAAPRYGCVATYTQQKHWVLNVCAPKRTTQILAADAGGDVVCYDFRRPIPAFQFQAGHMGQVAFAAHDYSNVLACGLPNQKIRICSYGGDQVSLLRYRDTFLGQRIPPVS